MSGLGVWADLQPSARGCLGGTFKREYVGVAELRDAESVLTQLSGWFADYNTQAPHGALGLRSPAEYRATLESVPPSV